MEFSDEEVLKDVESTLDDEDSEEEQEGQAASSLGQHRKGGALATQSDDGVEGGADDDEALETWGASKRDYYHQDEIEDEQDALEEEEEARRLQQKRLKRRAEADFGFDDTAWLNDDATAEKAAGDDARDGGAVTEVLPQLEITDDMGPGERLRLLHFRHPEFGPLSKEFIHLQPLYAGLKAAFNAAAVPVLRDSDPTPAPSVLSLKYHALTAYLGTLSIYFAFLTSTSEDGTSPTVAAASSDFKDHPIMESLLGYRQLWERVKDVHDSEPEKLGQKQDQLPAPDHEEVPPLKDGLSRLDDVEPWTNPRKRKRQAALEAAQAKAEQELAEKIRKTEEELAGLSAVTKQIKARSMQASKNNGVLVPNTADGDSDFAEDTVLDSIDAAEKARKRKTLRFYTSQIAQKANKRNNAGRDAGGDADLPYRERLKDRQARLNAQAEKRGQRNTRGQDPGEILGGTNDDEDNILELVNKDRDSNAQKDNDEEYYDYIAKTKRERKASKLSSGAPSHSQTRQGFEEESLAPDGKRAITYQIEKNKGLTPKRKKDVRNPRVKKRKKFAEKQKKLGSVRQVYKGSEERGGYAGEKTGIKTGLVKSVKL